jgi:hypothetical protein
MAKKIFIIIPLVEKSIKRSSHFFFFFLQPVIDFASNVRFLIVQSPVDKNARENSPLSLHPVLEFEREVRNRP